MKAAIFDMDGLLIDSEPFWRSSHVQTLADHGVAITEDDVREHAGKRSDEVVNHWRSTKGLAHLSTQELDNEVTSKVIYNIKTNGRELPGVRKVFHLLENHDIPIAVASSSSPSVIKAVIYKLGLEKHIKIACSARYEKFGKPHPAVFLTTAKKLGVKPAECAVFEDSLSGIRAAKAAGMRCVSVPEEVNRHKPEFAAESDMVIDSLREVTWGMLRFLFYKKETNNSEASSLHDKLAL